MRKTICSFAVCLGIALGILLGTLGYYAWDKHPPTVEMVLWSPTVQWISSREPSYGFYARSSVFLPGPVRGAWLRISAENDFSLYVNGQVIAEENLARSFKGVKQTNIGRINQSPDDDSAYRTLDPPVFLDASNDWKLTYYVDLTQHLATGRNTIAVAVHSSKKTARMAVEGKIYPVDGGVPIPIQSDATAWKSASVAESHHGVRWFQPEFFADDWSQAKALGPVREATYSRLSAQLFDRLLHGTWITGTESELGEVILGKTWRAPPNLKRAYLRFSGQGQYSLVLNEHLIEHERGIGETLHAVEVSNCMTPGDNMLSVRLVRSRTDFVKAQSLSSSMPLAFYLDGWAETEQGDIVSLIATDDTWINRIKTKADQAIDGDTTAPATLIGPITPHHFTRTFEGDAYLRDYPDSLGHRAIWLSGGIVLVLVGAWLLGRFWFWPTPSFWRSLTSGMTLMLPGTLYLLGFALLRHRYSENEKILLFVQPHSLHWTFIGFLAITLLTLIWSSTSRKNKPLTPDAAEQPLKRLSPVSSSWLLWSAGVTIIAIAILFRLYSLDQAALFADEGTTLDAARGILYRGGAPILAADIWYTRSPAYHYLLALWLGIFGDSIYAARSLSVLWGGLTIGVVFLFTRRLTGNAWIALLVCLLLAFDPFKVLGSRIIRFYQASQCLTTLSFWFFYEGYIRRQARSYRYRIGFLLLLIATLLSLETSVILLPCFFLGFLYFYRRIQIKADWPLFLLSGMILVIFAYDMAVFDWRCLTPPLVMSSSTGSIAQPNVFDLPSFSMSLLSGAARINVIYSVFFILGAVYFTVKKRGELLFFFGSILIYIAELSFLILQTRARYFSIIYPLFIILSVYSAISMMQSVGDRFDRSLTSNLPVKKICVAAVGVLLFFNLELVNTVKAHGNNIADRQIELFEYVRDHKQSEDLVLSFQAQLAAITLDELDYLIVNIPRFDHLYQTQRGSLADRWAGGEAIFNVDQLQNVLAQAEEQVWIVATSVDPPGEATSITPFLNNLGEVVFETYGGYVRRWDKGAGQIERLPNRGGDIGKF